MGAPVLLLSLYSTQHLQLLLLYYGPFQTHKVEVDIHMPCTRYFVNTMILPINPKPIGMKVSVVNLTLGVLGPGNCAGSTLHDVSE